MFSRKCTRLISVSLLFYLLAWYSRIFLNENTEELLVSMWNRAFQRFGPDCIYWITMRLEGGFTVYLLLRKRSYGRVFVGTYIGCVGLAVCYYGVGTVIMAICHGIVLPGIEVGNLLGQRGLPLILVEEGLEALSFCLTAYVVHCLFRKAETGFLAVLVGRMILNFVTGGIRPELLVQMAFNLIMTYLVFLMAFRDFAEKFIEG